MSGDKAKARRDKWVKANPEKAKKANRDWAKRNPEKRRRIRLMSYYGITIEQYDRMLSLQGGACAICGNPPKTRALAVEHDHGPSKRVRGLACHRCNKYKIGTNTIETAKKVLAYLESDFDGRNL